LEKYKKRMTDMVEDNEQSVRKKKKKLMKQGSNRINNRKAFKITMKVSEYQRNVDYYKRELHLVNQAIVDIAHNQDTYAVNQAIARNELAHIKREMSFIIGAAFILYIMIYGASYLMPMMKIILPVAMTLITVICIPIYDMKCNQYNAYQKIEDKKIDNTLIAVGRPMIFKWVVIIFIWFIFVSGITPYFKLLILPYYTDTVYLFLKYIVSLIFKLLIEYVT
jgi:hypothetical protein